MIRYKDIFAEAESQTADGNGGFSYKGLTGANALSFFAADKYNVNAADNSAAHDALLTVMAKYLTYTEVKRYPSNIAISGHGKLERIFIDGAQGEFTLDEWRNDEEIPWHDMTPECTEQLEILLSNISKTIEE